MNLSLHTTLQKAVTLCPSLPYITGWSLSLFPQRLSGLYRLAFEKQYTRFFWLATLLQNRIMVYQLATTHCYMSELALKPKQR